MNAIILTSRLPANRRGQKAFTISQKSAREFTPIVRQTARHCATNRPPLCDKPPARRRAVYFIIFLEALKFF